MDRADDRGGGINDQRNPQKQEQPPLNGSAPEEQASKKTAYPFQSMVTPYQEDTRQTGSIDSQEEEWIAGADLPKDGGELIGKDHEKRHRNPTESKGEG